jgi:hypothetical protein
LKKRVRQGCCRSVFSSDVPFATEDLANLLLLHVLRVGVFWWCGEAQSLERNLQPNRNYRPTARETGWWVFHFSGSNWIY